jgi:hypothetical protein
MRPWPLTRISHQPPAASAQLPESAGRVLVRVPNRPQACLRARPCGPTSIPAHLRALATSLGEKCGLIVLAAATACTTLPNAQALPAGEEAAHAVTEITPGHWHVMVRVNDFASTTEAERLLGERAAALCGGQDAVLEDLRLVSQPHQAAAEVHCRLAEGTGVAGGGGIPNGSRWSTDAGPVHPHAMAAPERSMVKSGPGVAVSRPEPAYLPAFASVAADRPIGDEPLAAAAEEATVADGWIPATGHTTGTAAVACGVEDLATPPQREGPERPFWPTVRDAYDALVAEIE